MMEGQQAFTWMAMMNAVSSGLMVLRYSPTAVYSAATIANGQFQMFDQAYNWSVFAFWAVAAITQ